MTNLTVSDRLIPKGEAGHVSLHGVVLKNRPTNDRDFQTVKIQILRNTNNVCVTWGRRISTLSPRIVTNFPKQLIGFIVDRFNFGDNDS